MSSSKKSSKNKEHWDQLGQDYNSKTWNNEAKNWLSDQETEWIKRSIGNLEKKDLNVLEFGAGNGRITDILLTMPNIKSIDIIDISTSMVSVLKSKFENENKIHTINQFDLENDNLDILNKYDVIIGIRAIKYNPSWQKILENLHGHLNPGGLLIFDMLNINSLNFFGKYIIPIYKTNYNKILDITCKLNIKTFEISGFTRLPDILYHVKPLGKLIIITEKILNKIFGNTLFTRIFYITIRK